MCTSANHSSLSREIQTEDEVVLFIKELDYSGRCDMLSAIHIDQMHQPWRTFAAIINRSIFGKTTRLDRLREISSTRKEHMPYPRFTKVIINHFIFKDKTISMRNIINLYTIYDDNLLGPLKFVSKTEDYQKYGALIPDGMINQDFKDSKAFKTYYDFITGRATPKKARKFKKLPYPQRNCLIGKGIELLSNVALLEVAQLKKVLKKIKQNTHMLHASGSSERADFELEGNSKDDNENDDDNNDESGNDNDGGNDAHDTEKTYLDDDENPSFTLKDDEEEEYDEESRDPVHEEERKKYKDMTDTGRDDATQDTSYKQVIDDAHVSQQEPSTQIPSSPIVPVKAIPNSSVAAATTLYTMEFEKKAQAKRKRYIDLIEKSVKEIIKDEVKSQLPKILPKEVSNFATLVIQSTVTESLENIVLAQSSSRPKSTYEAAASLTEFELKKILLDKMQKREMYRGATAHRELYNGLVKSYTLDKDLFNSNGKEYSLKRDINDRLDWNNLEGHEYLFDLRNTQLPLQKKAARYDNIQGIEDMVPTLWSPLKGHKVSKHDVFSKKQIIAVTQVKVMNQYNYGHLEEFEVRREDQTLHKFKECNFPNLNLRDIKDITVLHDIASNLEMDYLAKRRWSERDTTRSRTMIKVDPYGFEGYSNHTQANDKATFIPSLIANCFNADLCKDGRGVGNKVDVVVPMESIRAISDRFANTAFVSFWESMIFSFQFSSMEGLDAMLENGSWFIRNNPLILKKWNSDVNIFKKCRSSYVRVMIKVWAAVELKDNIVVVMPKLVGEGFHTCNVRVEYEWKPPDVSKKNNVSTSGNKKKNVKPTKEVSKSNLFDVLNSVKNDVDLTTSGGTSNLTSKKANSSGSPLIIDGMATLVDDDDKLLTMVVSSSDHDSEDEVASVDNDMANFLASKDVGYGTNSLLEQWKESYGGGEYDYDPYDDDIYEGQDIPDKIKDICDNLDIKV
nr:hypothetical protein [Tanacetum cinerariifolium]